MDRSGVGVLVTEVDIDFLRSVRARFPVFNHRRPEIYHQLYQGAHALETESARTYSVPLTGLDSDSFLFGDLLVKRKFVFLESQHSRAFVNQKCFLPGRKSSTLWFFFHFGINLYPYN